MSTNVAQIIGGPCLISYDGQFFRSKADVKLDTTLETFQIATDLWGNIAPRVNDQPIKLSFAPEGRFASLAVLFPYLLADMGSFITPRHECGAVVSADDTIEVFATDLPAGTPISFGTTGVMPAGLTAATLYYLSADVSGLRTIHTSAAAAIAGTGAVNITDDGSGDLAFVIQKVLVIVGKDRKRYTFHNSAITKMPEINFASTSTLWGDCEFCCLPKNGVPWSTANSIYTIDTFAFSDTGFNPADIITQPYSFTWGSGVWANVFTKAGIKVSNTMGLTDTTDDASGRVTYRLDSLGFTATAQPMGPSLSDVLTSLKLQGAGAVRGRSLTGADFNIEATGVYARLYAASPLGGPAQWSSKNDRLGDMTWQATRTWTDGEANPLFYIGSAAPA